METVETVVDTSTIYSETDKKVLQIQKNTMYALTFTVLATGFGIGYFAKANNKTNVLVVGLGGVLTVVGLLLVSDFKTWNALAPKENTDEKQ